MMDVKPLCVAWTSRRRQSAGVASLMCVNWLDECLVSAVLPASVYGCLSRLRLRPPIACLFASVYLYQSVSLYRSASLAVCMCVYSVCPSSGGVAPIMVSLGGDRPRLRPAGAARACRPHARPAATHSIGCVASLRARCHGSGVWVWLRAERYSSREATAGSGARRRPIRVLPHLLHRPFRGADPTLCVCVCVVRHLHLITAFY